MKPCSSLIAVLPLLCAMASCTEVDLCQAEHPHRSFMDFRFHWKEEYQGNRPDSMGVIAVRPVNILRYEFRITAEESHNNGIPKRKDSLRPTHWLRPERTTYGYAVVNITSPHSDGMKVNW